MRSYLRYLAERLVVFGVTVLLSVTVVFVVPRAVPGNPLGAVLLKLAEMGGAVGAQALIEEYKKIFGLDRPLLVQYLNYLRELLRGNLGYSIAAFPSRVSLLIMRALPWTIGLLLVTTLTSWATGTLMGAVIGWRGAASKLARLLVPAALVLYAIPYYILAIILIFLFVYLWPVLPLSGGYSARVELSVAFLANLLRHAILPALSIILVSLGWWFLSMRSMIISLLGEDYILLAQAKGLHPRRILWKYAFRNALLPQVTGLAISLSRIVAGAIITEVIFAYPGIGWLLFNSITGLDYPVIQGSVLLIILSVAFANFALDLLYPLIDPRIRVGRA